MTASADPAAFIRLPMSGDSPRTSESVDALCECEVPPDIEDMAESMEEVRGTPRARAARCSGTEDIGGVAAGGLPPNLAAATGSDVLLVVLPRGLEDWSDLSELVSIHSKYLFTCKRTAS